MCECGHVCVCVRVCVTCVQVLTEANKEKVSDCPGAGVLCSSELRVATLSSLEQVSGRAGGAPKL